MIGCKKIISFFFTQAFDLLDSTYGQKCHLDVVNKELLKKINPGRHSIRDTQDVVSVMKTLIHPTRYWNFIEFYTPPVPTRERRLYEVDKNLFYIFII